MNYVPEKYEHLVHYYDYYSNPTRSERRTAKQHDAEPAHADERPIPAIDEATGDPTKRAHWARLIKKVYEVDPLECPRCAAPMRLIALIEKPDIVERILKHLNGWRLSYRPVQKENVRFGSFPAVEYTSRPMAAYGHKRTYNRNSTNSPAQRIC